MIRVMQVADFGTPCWLYMPSSVFVCVVIGVVFCWIGMARSMLQFQENIDNELLENDDIPESSNISRTSGVMTAHLGTVRMDVITFHQGDVLNLVCMNQIQWMAPGARALCNRAEISAKLKHRTWSAAGQASVRNFVHDRQYSEYGPPVDNYAFG